MNKRFALSLLIFPAIALSGCKEGRRDVSADLSEARRFIADGNDAKAGAVLRDALKAQPLDAQVNLLLGEVEDRAGDMEDAVPHYLRAASSDGTLVEPQTRIIQILLDSNRYAEASGRINFALGSFPNNADVLALRADLAERQGQYAAATNDARAALAKDAFNARALAVLAIADLQANNQADALKELDLGLSKHPDDLKLLQVQAAALLTANQPEKAEQSLKAIVQRSPRNVSAQVALADVQVRNGDLAGAMDDFKAAIAADPSDTDLQLAFAKFLEQQKGFGAAVDHLNGLIARNPDSVTYDLALAGLYRSDKKLDQSQATLEKAAARLPPGKAAAPVKVALARVAEDRGRNDLAQVQLDAVLLDDPSNEQALFLRAQLSLQNGRVQSAVDDLLNLVKADPVNGPAFNLLATAYLAEGESKLAVEAIRRAVAVTPDDAGSQLKLAIFLENAGDVEGAREVMARMMLQRPGDPDVWVSDAQIALHRNDWSEAGRAIRRLQDLPGGASWALVLQGQMQVARGDYAGGVQFFRKALATRSGIGAQLINAFAHAAVAAGQAGESAQQLTEIIPGLPAADQQTAWLAVMALDAKAGQAAKADAAFGRAAALAPGDVAVYSAYIDILLDAKNFDRARQVLAAGYAAHASRPDLLILQGLINQSAGDLQAAQTSYREALDANPLSLAAANNYASLLVDREPQNTAALTQLRARLNSAEGTTDPNIADTIAWLDYRLGRFDEAKALLTRIKAGESQNPQIRLHMAAVLLATGDRPGGLALLDTLKGLTFPGSEEIRSLSAS